MQAHRAASVVVVATLVAAVTAGCGGKSHNAASQRPSTESTETTTTEAPTSNSAGEATTAVPTATTLAGAATTTTAKPATIATKTTSVLTKNTAPPPTVGGFANATTSTTKAPTEPPQPGGTLTILEATEGAGLDPTVATGSIGGTDPQKLFAEYDALVYQDPNTGSVVPDMAQSMTTTDGKVWTLTLRPNIKFTDGTPYDAAAVKFNWDRCTNNPDPNAKPCTNKTVTTSFTTAVTGPLTLTITLSAVNGQFPRLITAGGALSYIGSPTAEAATTQANFNTHPVGAGPFIFKDWVTDSEMSFTRNPSYWNAPRPYIDTLVFKPVTDEGQRTSSFKAGEAQLEYTPSLQNATDMAKNFQVLSVPSINVLLQQFNFTRAPFNDLNARKAIQLSVDLDQYNSTFFPGQPAPTGFFPPNYPYSDPSLAFPKPDLTKAQQFADAYSAAHGGSDLSFTWTTSSTTLSAQEASLVQQQVQRLNHVKMSIKQESTQAIVSDIVSKNYDMISISLTGVDPEPQFFAQVGTNGSRNFTGYSSSTVDQDIAASRAATDPNTRIAALKKLQQDLLGDVPFLVMNLNPTIWAEQPNIRDFAAFDEGGPLVDRVWIKTH
jgi:peptide/nickel transport system substrate-binding protein